MTDTTLRFNEMITALKEKGFRLTPQRMALVHLIASSEGHPSAAQLYERIQHQFPTISQATVYKTLALLKEMGQVLEIDMHDDSHYDGNRIEPHPHLICVKCGKIMDGEADFLQSEIRKLETATGYTILHLQVSFFGLCPDCKEKDV